MRSIQCDVCKKGLNPLMPFCDQCGWDCRNGLTDEIPIFERDEIHRKGEFDLAIADYTKAIAINPDDAYAYTCRGYAYRKIGWENKAKSDFEKYENM